MYGCQTRGKGCQLTEKSNAQFVADFVQIVCELFPAVLHNPARVGQGYNFPENFEFVVEPLQVSKVFTVTQTVTFFGAYAQRYLLYQALYDEGFETSFQFFVIVIIKIFTVFCKAKRTHGTHVIMSVKRNYSPHVFDKLINKQGREFRFFFKIIGNAAGFFQSNRIGKRDAGYSCAKPAGINAQYYAPRAVVAVKLAVKKAACLPCFLRNVGI